MNAISFKVIWKGIIDAFDVRDRRVGYVIGTGASTSMAPTAHGAASLQVDIAAGNYSKNGADASTVYAGGNITLTAAHATLPRVDIVYMDSTGTLSKTGGTAAAIVAGTSGPVPAAWPAGCCPLAICFVPSGATDFTTGGYVLDARPFGVVPVNTGLVGDGTVAAPGLAFTSETGSGLYRIGAGDVALAILGVKVAEFTATAATIVQALTVSSTLVVSGASITVGTSPATSGTLRMPNAGTIKALNAAGNGNLTLQIGDASNRVTLWDSTSAADQFLRTTVADGTGHLGASQRVWGT